MNLELLGMYVTHAEDRGWFRLKGSGWGFDWTRARPLFSERHGIHKRWTVPFNSWRIGILRPHKAKPDALRG